MRVDQRGPGRISALTRQNGVRVAYSGKQFGAPPGTRIAELQDGTSSEHDSNEPRNEVIPVEPILSLRAHPQWYF